MTGRLLLLFSLLFQDVPETFDVLLPERHDLVKHAVAECDYRQMLLAVSSTVDLHADT